MPAFLYKKIKSKESIIFTNVKKISLAGYNAIFHLWESRDNPINFGWHITNSDLINYILESSDDNKNYSIILDSAPSRKSLVDFKELHDLYIYTFGDENTREVHWSAMMIVVSDIFWSDIKDDNEKESYSNQFTPKQFNGELIYSFLYIHGMKRSWNWGRLGQMNGAWLYKDARKYFCNYFCKDA